MWYVIARCNGRDLSVAGYRSAEAACEFAATLYGRYELVRVTYSKIRGQYTRVPDSGSDTQSITL